jgi:hypothetical protein
MALQTREVGAQRASEPAPIQRPVEQPVYTRYCAAPPPLHPVGEPRYLRALLLAMWLGRLGLRPAHEGSAAG